MAIDGAGRLIVVSDRDSEPLSDASRSAGDVVSVSLRRATCLTESVPAHGSEDACKDECDYNRIRETYAIETDSGTPEWSESGPPAALKSVPVDRVELPGVEDFQDDGEFVAPGPTHADLHEPATSFNQPEEVTEDNRVRSCGQPDPDRVYLGSFRRGEEGWTFVDPGEESVPRPHVYTNDMLYAGLLDHVTDFENPHDVSVTIYEETEDPYVGVEGQEVRFVGEDGIEVEGDDGTIHLSGGGGGMEVLEPLARYLEGGSVRRDALRQTACAFEKLRDQFEYVEGEVNRIPPAAIADGVVRDARDGLSDDGDYDRVYEDPDEFAAFLREELESPFESFVQALPDFVGNTAEFEAAWRHLATVISDVPPADADAESANWLALALLRFCEAASCLSGRCIRFDQFADQTPVTSPLTVKDVVVNPRLPELPMAWNYVPRIVSSEDAGGRALEFYEPQLRVEVPPTDEARVVGVAADFSVAAADADDNVIDRDAGGSGDTLSVSRDPDEDAPITYLEVGFESDSDPSEFDGETLDALTGEELERFQSERPSMGQLVSICVR